MRIKPYNRIDELTELGDTVELLFDSASWIVTGMNVREIMIRHTDDFEKAESIVLKSQEIGNWKYNKEIGKWEKLKEG